MPTRRKPCHNEITCTIGKDGRKYYFLCGKRITAERGRKSGTSCGKSTTRRRSPKRGSPKKTWSPISQRRKKVRFASPVKTPIAIGSPVRVSQTKVKMPRTYKHIWLLKDMSVPVRGGIHEPLLIPFKRLGDIKMLALLVEEKGADNLVLATDKQNARLLEFQDQRFGWSAKDWETKFPHLIDGLKYVDVTEW